MFDRKELIEDVMETVIEKTDLDPGEVNENITKVMGTMEEANEKFQEMDAHIARLIKASNRLDESGTEVAEAGVEMAKASKALGEAVSELSDTQEEMSSNMADLEETLEKLDNHIPEE